MLRHLRMTPFVYLISLLILGGMATCTRTDGSNRGDHQGPAASENGNTGGPADTAPNGNTQPEARTSDTAVVTMEDLDFVPARITIDSGQTVLWRNTSALVHTLTAVRELANNPANVALPPGAEPFNSGDLQPGEQFAHTFIVPGEYRYFCIPHENAGMIGSVTVRENGGR